MAESVFILAGEASGDKLGGSILAEMKARGYSPNIVGVGGPDMQAQGLQPLFPMDDLSILGIKGAIANYWTLKKRLALLIDHIRSTRPRFILTIDSKTFSLKLGKMLKKVMAKEGWSIPVIHLVAPTVWVWAGWRAKTMHLSVDHLLCLFPFEVPYFTQYGTSAVAVGHPARDITWPSVAKARERLGLKKQDYVIGLFPGSRRREVAELLPDMCLAVKAVRRQYPDVKAILPAAETVHHLIEEYLTPEDDVHLVGEDQRYEVMKAADYGLLCSGTLTLETALAGLAGSVYYRPDALSMFVGRRLVDRSKIVLPNAISGHELYDLFLGREFTEETMADAILHHRNKGNTLSLDIASHIKTALTPEEQHGKRGVTFQRSVVDQIDRFLNGL